jgi:predicted nucleic acid-binding protein
VQSCLVPPGEVARPAVAAYEVWVGVLGSQNAQRRQAEYERFLSVIEVLPFDAVPGKACPAELHWH